MEKLQGLVDNRLKSKIMKISPNGIWPLNSTFQLSLTIFWTYQPRNCDKIGHDLLKSQNNNVIKVFWETNLFVSNSNFVSN